MVIVAMVKIELGQGFWSASGGGNLQNNCAGLSKRDGTIAVPVCLAVSTVNIAENDRSSPAHGHFLQFAAGKKSKPLSIWREKGMGHIFSPGDRLRHELIHRAQVQLGGITSGSSICETRTVPREGHDPMTPGCHS